MYRKYKDSYVIYISGPDGSGKSTVIENLCKSLTVDNIHVRTFHHVNDVLDRRLMLKRVSDFSKYIPLRPLRVRIEILLHEMYYVIKFTRKLNQERKKSNFILVDRCIIDKVCSAYVRNLNYLYRVRLVLSWFFPRPSSTVIIYADAYKIVSRKQELTHGEILKYYNILNKFRNSSWKKIVVQNDNVDEAVEVLKEKLNSTKFDLKKLFYLDNELVPIIKKYNLTQNSLNNTGFKDIEGNILIKRGGDIDSIVNSVTLKSLRKDINETRYFIEEYRLVDRVKFRFYDDNGFFIYQFDIRIENYGSAS